MFNDWSLKKIMYLSYKSIWILLAGAFLSALINHIFSLFSLMLTLVGNLLGLMISIIIEIRIGHNIKEKIIRYNESRKNLIDKKLYGFLDGWATFMLSIFLTLMFALIGLNPKLNLGIYLYLLPPTIILFLLSFIYGILSKKI
jgi:hypothetical protein